MLRDKGCTYLLRTQGSLVFILKLERMFVTFKENSREVSVVFPNKKQILVFKKINFNFLNI